MNAMDLPNNFRIKKNVLNRIVIVNLIYGPTAVLRPVGSIQQKQFIFTDILIKHDCCYIIHLLYACFAK